MDEVIAVVAATAGVWAPILVSVLALLVSLSNRRISKRALSLGTDQENRRLLGLKYSLLDSASVEISTSGTRWIGVQLLVVNPSDRPTALVTAELRVTYELDDRTVIAKISHRADNVPVDFRNSVLSVPKDLGANSAVTGWLLFPLEPGLIAGPITSFAALVNDSRQTEESVDIWPVRGTKVVQK